MSAKFNRIWHNIIRKIENLRANINYLHDNIVECQQNIVQMEQANENEEDERDEIAKIVDIGELDFEESKYLLEKIFATMKCEKCVNRWGRKQHWEQEKDELVFQSIGLKMYDKYIESSR